ncbi:MAG: hypothetical protein JWR89_4992 [Tardiphaga sp.]|uniref:hypothetical protein n=1 Tax=Tardiphaga sp. TaxID=1926292 RepID=UPI0026322E9C|nr:hypothetical protein [Tardiphaga sp.]MDB5505090.1 hypothetical protein [Tardiphaga sp.]
MRDSNQLSYWFCLVGGAFGSVAGAVCWWSLGALLWLPYWKTLSAHHMISDDIGWALGLYIVPPVIGFMMLIATAISIGIVRASPDTNRKGLLILIHLIPGLALSILQLSNWTRMSVIESPGFEIAVLAIGLCWALMLIDIMKKRRTRLGLAPVSN